MSVLGKAAGKERADGGRRTDHLLLGKFWCKQEKEGRREGGTEGGRGKCVRRPGRRHAVNGRAGQRIQEGTDPACVVPRAGGMDVAFHVVVDDGILVRIGSSFRS